MNENWRHIVNDAAVLANMLPEWVPEPTSIHYDSDVYADDINFEWCYDARTIMVIFMANGRPSWAGLCDGHSSHGISSICNKIPEECLTLLRNVVNKLNKRK